MRTFVIVSSALIAVGSAKAADLPTKATLFAPTFNWTGLYAGINGGYGWAKQGSASASGGFGGGQLGYNWQAIGAPLVLGVEADIQGSGISGSNIGTNGPLAITEVLKANYFGTVRGRVGYAIDRWMPYTTGGVAYSSIKHDGAGLAGVAGTYSTSNAVSGYTIGGGVEGVISDRWTYKVEYLYSSFSRVTNTYTTTAPAITVAYSRVNLNLIRAGLNYRF